MKYEKTRTLVLEAILEANRLGLIHGTAGNISARYENENIAVITPSGVPYKSLSPEKISIVSLDGEWLDGPNKPSSETPMHTAVYRARPDVGAVVHTHSLYATVMGMDGGTLPVATPPAAEMWPVKTVPFIMPASEELAKGVVETLGDGRAVLMKNHGMLCVGKDMKAAMTGSILVEECAKVVYHARLLGTFEPMPEDAVKKMQIMISGGSAV